MKKIFALTLKLIQIIVALAVVGALLYAFYSVMDFALRSILPSMSISVLSNFIVFSSVIIILICRLNVKSKLENAVEEVDNSIKESEETKVESEKKLSSIEESMNHLSEEVDMILKQSEYNAQLVGKKIAEDTEKSLVVLKENTQKAIDNSHSLLRNDIIRRASLASVEVAKSHIIRELAQNNELHDRLIDESISTIEGIEL